MKKGVLKNTTWNKFFFMLDQFLRWWISSLKSPEPAAWIWMPHCLGQSLSNYFLLILSIKCSALIFCHWNASNYVADFFDRLHINPFLMQNQGGIKKTVLATTRGLYGGLQCYLERLHYILRTKPWWQASSYLWQYRWHGRVHYPTL